MWAAPAIADCSVLFRGLLRFGSRTGKSSKCRSIRIRAPLILKSPAGKLLTSVLNDTPEMFPAIAAEQLENLALEREAAIARCDQSLDSSQECLHLRISEVKDDDGRIAIEEIMYMMIVYQFSNIKVSMFPHITWLTSESLDTIPSYEDELKSFYDKETQDMVKIHLLNILSWINTINGGKTNSAEAQIERLHLGRMYATSIMYGYFLKSASLRYHLEYLLSLSIEDHPLNNFAQIPGLRIPPYNSHQQSLDANENFAPLKRKPQKTKSLKNYINKFDSIALKICASLKSCEANDLIEKHIRALLLNKGGNTFEEDKVSVNYSSLKHLVLEAVTFGCFLWDVERRVDSVYNLSCHF